MPKAAALFLISILFLSCGETKEVTSEEKGSEEITITEKVKWVDTVHVNYREIAAEIRAEGRLRLPQTVLSVEKSGNISEINIREGKRVRKGDLLIQLDTNELSLNFKEAVYAVKAAQYRQHLLYLQRVLGYENPGDSIPSNVVKAISMESGLYEALIMKEKAWLSLRKATERAPFSGLVSNVKISPFQFVSSGEAFCTLLDTEKMEVEVDLLETEVAQLRHTSVKNIVGKVSFPEQSEKQYAITLGEVNPLVDAQGFVRVRFRLLETLAYPLQNMRAKVQILCNPRKGLAIPETAILIRDKRPVVFVYNNEKAIWRYIETGQKMQNAVEVRSGLKAGEALIVAGHLNLAHLSTVKVIEP